MPAPKPRQQPPGSAARGVAAGDEALSRRLQAAGLRRTPVRLAVLGCLAAQRRALSHAEIAEALAGEADRVTLYRALDSFVEAGLVSRHVGEDRVSRFVLDDGVDHDAHAHFTCGHCGTVYCMPLAPPRRAGLPEGFQVEAASLSFRGACASCTAAAGAKSRR